jgi:3,2-trans-enoyl-CoA isomerase
LLVKSKRWFSSVPLVITSVNEETKIATLTLNRPPVNSLNLELCEAISQGVSDVEANPKAQALILTSSQKVYCAGLDLTELHQPNEGRLITFWTALQQVYLDLYGSRLATIAAISGAAPAAGCMLAMACDYRVASTKSVIGLNEAQFGIVAPPWMAQLMVDTVGRRKAEQALMLGTLYPSQQALEMGLVDSVVEPIDLVASAESVAKEWIKVPPHSRHASKMMLRKPQLEHLQEKRSQDLQLFLGLCLSDKVQKSLGVYLESLKNKKE